MIETALTFAAVATLGVVVVGVVLFVMINIEL
jgi:hypothetical protein